MLGRGRYEPGQVGEHQCGRCSVPIEQHFSGPMNCTLLPLQLRTLAACVFICYILQNAGLKPVPCFVLVGPGHKTFLGCMQLQKMSGYTRCMVMQAGSIQSLGPQCTQCKDSGSVGVSNANKGNETSCSAIVI